MTDPAVITLSKRIFSPTGFTIGIPVRPPKNDTPQGDEQPSDEDG
jgi:hypothetical protein